MNLPVDFFRRKDGENMRIKLSGKFFPQKDRTFKSKAPFMAEETPQPSMLRTQEEQCIKKKNEQLFTLFRSSLLSLLLSLKKGEAETIRKNVLETDLLLISYDISEAEKKMIQETVYKVRLHDDDINMILNARLFFVLLMDIYFRKTEKTVKNWDKIKKSFLNTGLLKEESFKEIFTLLNA